MQLQKTVSWLENSAVPMRQFLLTGVFFITLRMLLEFFLNPFAVDIAGVFHFYISYVATLLGFALWISYVAHVHIRRSLRLLGVAIGVTVLPPLIDLVLGRNTQWITYLFPSQHDDLFWRFLTIGGSIGNFGGMTWGIKIEVAIILLFSLWYFWTKTRSILLSFFGAVGVYCIIFFLFIVPFLIQASLALFDEIFVANHMQYNQFYVIVLSVLLFFVGYADSRRQFWSFICDVRPLRLAYYCILVLVGTAVAVQVTDSLSFGSAPFYYYVLGVLSIAYAWIYSVITNNREDLVIDSVSNAGRPLIKGSVDEQRYVLYEWITLALSLLCGFLINATFGVIVLGFIAMYYLYSLFPIRFKRVLLVSKLAIGGNTLLALLAGFVLMGQPVTLFPLSILLFVLLFVTLGANFIDLKDYHGDKAAGVLTLPVLLGLRRAKFVVGTIFFCGYVVIGVLLGSLQSIIAFGLLGSLSMFLINREKYSDRMLMVVIVFSVMLFLLRVVL